MTDQRQPMTPERLAEIGELCTAAGAPFPSPHPKSAGYIIPELLAEVLRLQSAVSDAEAWGHNEVERANATADYVIRERDARIAALETGLRTACDLLDEWIECHTALDSCEDEPDWATSTRLRVLADTTKEA